MFTTQKHHLEINTSCDSNQEFSHAVSSYDQRETHTDMTKISETWDLRIKVWGNWSIFFVMFVWNFLSKMTFVLDAFEWKKWASPEFCLHDSMRLYQNPWMHWSIDLSLDHHWWLRLLDKNHESTESRIRNYRRSQSGGDGATSCYQTRVNTTILAEPSETCRKKRWEKQEEDDRKVVQTWSVIRRREKSMKKSGGNRKSQKSHHLHVEERYQSRSSRTSLSLMLQIYWCRTIFKCDERHSPNHRHVLHFLSSPPHLLIISW